MKNVLFFLMLIFLATACVESTTNQDNTPDTTPDDTPTVKTPCEESPANPMEIEWMATMVNKHKIEQVIRYDLDTKPVYFFKIIRCCDFQSFLVDCEGKQICVDGGITGGTCKERMKALKNEKILWQVPNAEAAKDADEKAKTTSQPNK